MSLDEAIGSSTAINSTSPLPVVSCDSHVGPTLAQMRTYCPSERLDEYDAFAANMGDVFDVWADLRHDLRELEEPATAALKESMYDRNRQTAGHTDMNARRRDMDRDGVAVDVIFHSSQNGQPIPFVPGGSLWFNPTTGDLERASLGFRIYNAWLADACATAPERHIGVAQIPAWDIDASIREVEWVNSVGLRSVNLPTPRPGIPIYDHPDWEPFWSRCEEFGMSLNTHVGGAGGPVETIGRHRMVMMYLELSGWLSRRGLPRMLFSGVFERHPGLNYVLTEQNGEWWTAIMREYDSAYKTHYWQLKEQMPKKPSEYCATNVFIGASFMAPFEAHRAVDEGYVNNVMWGSDYPHAEGTFQYPDDPTEEPTTRIALRNTFSSIGAVDVRKMVGENAIRCFGLDEGVVRRTASSIHAPTLDELGRPVEQLPEWTASMAYRSEGPWG